MASLEKLYKELKKETQENNSGESIYNDEKKLVKGRKRRVWLENETDDNSDNKASKENTSSNLFKHDNEVNTGGISVYDLRGNPIKVLLYLESTIENKGNIISTNKITLKELSILVGISKNSTKTAIRFLLANKFLIKKEIKVGRNGWSVYEIPKKIYSTVQRIKDRKTISPNEHDINKQDDHLGNSDAPEIWFNIDTEELQKSLNNFDGSEGQIFGLSQIKKIQLQNKLSAEDVQLSIDHFSYGLQYHSQEAPYNKMKTPAGFLMGVLKNGDKWEEPRYLSKQERTIKDQFQKIAEGLVQKKSVFFEKWIGEETESKRGKFRALLPSNHYFGENEFREFAWKEFNKTEWAVIVKKEVVAALGKEKEHLIEKWVSEAGKAATG